MKVGRGERGIPLSLDELPNDVIALIATALDDTLEPWHIHRLSRTSRGMTLALALVTEHCRTEHKASCALLERVGMQWRTLAKQPPARFEAQKKQLTSSDAPVLCRLLQSAALARITHLDLIDCALGDSAVDVVCAAAAGGGLEHVTRLYLSGNSVGTPGSCALGRCMQQGHLRKLQGLYLHHNDLGDAGVSAFADALKHGALPALKWLGLVEVGISSVGIKSLVSAAECGGLARLQWLFVYRNLIDVTGAEALAQAIFLSRFVSLNRINISPVYHNVDFLLSACEVRGVRIDGVTL